MKFTKLIALAAFVTTTDAKVLDGKKFDAAEDKFNKFLENAGGFFDKDFRPNLKTYADDLKKAEMEYQKAQQDAFQKFQKKMTPLEGQLRDLKNELRENIYMVDEAKEVLTPEGVEKFTKLQEKVRIPRRKIYR